MRSSLLGNVENLRSGLDYHLARHEVLVSNLAQVDMPSYQAVDLARDDFKGVLHVAMQATQSGHFGGASANRSGYYEAQHAGLYRMVPDGKASTAGGGNGIDIDREDVKIASNQMRFDALAQLASAELATLAWAAGDGRTG